MSGIDIIPIKRQTKTMTSTSRKAPEISQAELQSFHDAHFGRSSIDHFAAKFIPPHDERHAAQEIQSHQDEVFNDYEDEDEEDDGLGYYDDGVKRTLTDEQIAMFRHSELEALRRTEESKDSKREALGASAIITEASSALKETEPGELPSDDNMPSATKTAGKKKKRRRTKARAEPEKPDLRKRTWDVVDTGLSSLDYGDEQHGTSSTPGTAQRRRITYDDHISYDD